MNNITVDQADRMQKSRHPKDPLPLLQSAFDPDPGRCKFSSTQRRKYLIEIEIGIESAKQAWRFL
jgi:hypothetical protein